MDLKTARIWQDVLLWGGAVVSLVGAWGFQNTVTALVGLMMMGASLIVCWRFYRCPKCGEQIGITVLTPDAHPLIHTPIPFMGYVQAKIKNPIDMTSSSAPATHHRIWEH